MSKETGMERAYVKCSRPTGPYVIYAILLFAFIVVPAWLLCQGKDPRHLDLHEDFYYLAGSMFGFYAGARSWEKVKGALTGVLAGPTPTPPQGHPHAQAQ